VSNHELGIALNGNGGPRVAAIFVVAFANCGIVLTADKTLHLIDLNVFCFDAANLGIQEVFAVVADQPTLQEAIEAFFTEVRQCG